METFTSDFFPRQTELKIAYLRSMIKSVLSSSVVFLRLSLFQRSKLKPFFQQRKKTVIPLVTLVILLFLLSCPRPILARQTCGLTSFISSQQKNYLVMLLYCFSVSFKRFVVNLKIQFCYIQNHNALSTIVVYKGTPKFP